VSLSFGLNGLLCAQTPTLNSISPSFAASGTEVTVTLTGTGFVAPMTVNTSGALGVTNLNILSSTLATATISVPPATPGEIANVTVTTSNSSLPLSFFVFPSIPPINIGDSVSGSLDSTDGRDPLFLNAYADLYQLTLNATTTFTVDLRSTAFNPQLYLLSSSGSIPSFSVSGSGYSQLTWTLPAGTYYIDASSNSPLVTGVYTLSINVLPMLSSISRTFAVAGTSLPVTLTGARFEAGMTVNAGNNLNVTNLNFVSSTSATATINVPAGTQAGTTTVAVTTSAGMSNPVSFYVFASTVPISPGDTVSGSLDVSDGRNPFFTGAFADLYQLTLDAPADITIDLRSTAYPPLLDLASSSGSFIVSGNFGNDYSQISRTLSAGTYDIFASSWVSNVTGPYTISINVLPALSSVSPPFAVAGTSLPVTLTGMRFGAPMTVNVGSGVVSNANIASTTSATATVDLTGMPAGTTSVKVTTPAGTSNPVSFSIFPSIPSINPGDTISGSLDTSDGSTPFFPSAFADLYQLTLNSSTTVTIDQRSTAFSPRLYLLSSLGSLLTFATDGAGYSQITMALSPGTYYVAASSTLSSVTGPYTISINVLPTLTTISPPFAAAGTPLPVTLTGSRFAAPMTVSDSNGIFPVSNANVLSSTSATATINVPAGTPAGSTNVMVTTPAGTSNPVTLSVFPSIPAINPGDNISASLDAGDGTSPIFNNSLADLYQLTLNATTDITIDMRSDAFAPVMYLLSSSGTLIFFGGNGASYSQISTTLSAGTYYIDAASGSPTATGPYTISINVLPALSSISPLFGVAGTAVPVTLTGSRFAAPMTASIGNNVIILNVVSSTSATGTLNIPAAAPVGATPVTATTSTGTSNPRSFFVFPSILSIGPGDAIAGSLDPADGSNPFSAGAFADLYQLTLNATTAVTIDLRSTAYAPRLYLTDSTGSSLSFGTSGAGYWQEAMTLGAGTYYIVASSNSSGATGNYTISINVLPALSSISPPFVAAGTSAPVTLTGARLGAPMTVIAGTGTFSNISVSNVNVVSSTTATVTINVPAGTPGGVTTVTATTTTGTTNNVSLFVFPSVVQISPGDAISGSLDTTDGKPPFSPNAFADLYQLTLSTSTAVTIDMRSNAFTPNLYLMSASGSILNLGGGGDAYSQIARTLSAGTYYIVASSITANATGNYTISINVLPALTSIGPPFAAAGAALPVTLTGARFGAPMTVITGTGGASNVSFSDVNVVSSTSATATVSVPAGTPAGSTTVAAMTPVGTSNAVSLLVFPSIVQINPGDAISGSLDTTDGTNPYLTSAFGDLYQLTLNSNTDVTIDMRSTAFTPRLFLTLSSGSVMSTGTSGAGYWQIATTLSAGTYYIVASSNSSAATGAYTLSINVLPALTSVTPKFLAAGSSTPITLTGARLGAPMTVVAGTGAFSNMSVAGVNVASSTSATATVNVPGGTPSGSTTVTVMTSIGTSNSLTLFVVQSILTINPGDTVSGTLDSNDSSFGASVFDLYQMTLTATKTITIDLRSTAFTPRVSLDSSAGAFLQSGVNSAVDSQITTTLSPGTYYIFASGSSSTAAGPYTLAVSEKKVRGQITSQ
jgi:hypothetical protein